MNAVLGNIKRILDGKGIDYQISEHEAVYTSEDAARVRGADLRTGVKALVTKTSEGGLLLVLVRADKRADLEKIALLEGTRKLRLASPEEVLRTTGCEIGSVPPFGHVTKLKTYFDREILENEFVNFNAGLHTVSVRMKSGDLKSVIGGIVY
jgi:prolyl-tRNA editing enzyme YbaK/EbsC (Cys-tRNA(Pro) deacylase)